MSASWQVTYDTRKEIAVEAGGQPWSDGIIVTQPDGAELFVRVGDWLIKLPDGRYMRRSDR